MLHSPRSQDDTARNYFQQLFLDERSRAQREKDVLQITKLASGSI